MVGTTTGRSGRSPALTSRMEIMLGASAALSGRVAAGCESPALGIKAGALTVNVESGWKVLLRCWLGPTCPTWKRWTRDLAAWCSYQPARGGELGRVAGGWGIRC